MLISAPWDGICGNGSKLHQGRFRLHLSSQTVWSKAGLEFLERNGLAVFERLLDNDFRICFSIWSALQGSDSWMRQSL